MDKSDGRRRGGYRIQSVAHALDILEEFSGEEAELGVSGLARRLGLPKNKVFRLLATLKERGYLEQGQVGEAYRIGPVAVALAQAVVGQLGVVRLARPIMEELAKVSGETVNLGLVRDDRVVCVHSVEAPQPVRAVCQGGLGQPVWACALGLAQLAFERSWLERLRTPSPRGSRTRQRPAEGMEEALDHVEEARERGYVVDHRGQCEDLRCVGVPIQDYAGKVVAGLAVSGPACRLADRRIREEIAPLAMHAGRRLSARLGHLNSLPASPAIGTSRRPLGTTETVSGALRP